MIRHIGAALLFIASFFFISTGGYTQIGKILKAGEKALEKSPSKLTEKYFSNAPVTTSFDDAKTEVMLLGNFNPPDHYFSPLTDLNQNENGDYIVTEGLYTTMNKSFCLKAGTYGPSQGDGHLYAPLEGPKAYLIEKILENWLTKNADIPQTDVQCLIWAIIARTDVDKMQPKYKLTLARLLDKEDMAKLAANSLKDKALEAGMEKLKGEIPPSVYKVFEAERNLRNLYSMADAGYDQFEQMAILAGIAPPEDMIRQVSKARWSWHPNGYFIRLMPQGYSNTKIDVYIPMPVEVRRDSLSRISSVLYNGTILAELHYDKTVTADNEAVQTSVLTQIVFLNNLTGEKLPVKIQGGVHTAFVQNDFSIDKNSGTSGSRLRKFSESYYSETSSLILNADRQTKSKLFGLASTVHSLDSLSWQTLNKESNEYLTFLLNEAYNYSIYKSISLNEKAGKRNQPDNSAQEKWVMYSFSSRNSGPGLAQPMFQEPANINVTNVYSWYKHDPGVLDLPSNVATPANRSAQRIGQSKKPKDKPWYDKLPPCPCTYKEAQDSAKKKGSGWSDCGTANQTYHYGAVNEVRWIPPKAGMPGQQCTYDANGNLITSGIAAGSPDKVSPQGCGPKDISISSIISFPGHNFKDMMTFNSLPCWQYLRDWPANNANKCSSNAISGIDHMKDLVGDMTCPEVTDLLNEAAKSKTISDKLRDFLLGKTNNLSNTELVQELNKWAAKEGCPGKSICDVINEASGNLKKGF